MTPPIGFRIDKTTDPKGSLMEIRPAGSITDAAATPRPTGLATSRATDYAYRIAAVTAGIALLASIW
jgi:hypothetical protein